MEEEDKSIQSTYDSMAGTRSSFLEREQEFARLTIPYISLGESTYDGSSVNQHAFNSIGAEAVNHFSNRMALNLFPRNKSFFKGIAGKKLRADLANEKKTPTDVQSQITDIEKQALLIHEKLPLREKEIEALKRVILGGNCLFYLGKKARLYPLQNFVISRDHDGEILRLIVKEQIAVSRLDKNTRSKVESSAESIDQEGKVKMYTSAKLVDNMYEIEQAVGEIALPNPDGKMIQKIPVDKLPWHHLTWNRYYNESYGRGLVEDHYGDFYVIELLSEAIARGMVLMADIKYLVRPGAITDIDHFIAAPTGEFVSGVEGDIVPFQLDKIADFTKIQEVLDDYKRRIGRVFLMHSANRRDAERVTKFEIALDANELSITHGGNYSQFANQWQKPVAHWLLEQVDDSIDDSIIDVEVVTGIDALGKAEELNKIAQYGEIVALTQSWPPGVLERMKWAEFSATVRNALSLDTEWIMSDKEFAALKAAERKAQQEEMVNQGIANSIPKAVEGGIKQGTEG